MKERTLAIILAAWMMLAMTGCGGKADPEPAPEPAPAPAPEPEPEPEAPAGQEITLFVPDGEAMYLEEVPATLVLSPQAVVDALIAAGALPEGGSRYGGLLHQHHDLSDDA